MSMIKVIKINCEKKYECNTRELLYELEPYGIETIYYLDILVDNLTCMLECTRESLLITSNAEGRMAGQRSYVRMGEVCENFGEVQTIPDHDISDIKSDAAFILVVEKQTVLKRLMGLKRMAHDNYRLITPDIMWLGLRPSDLGKDKYEISESQRRLRKTHEDKYETNIGREKFVLSNAKWVDEVDLMKDAHNKANLESLGDNLSKTFLPKKLRDADWI
ncbi:meiotic recombination protein SPO11 [Prunus yedoensis var. nudiflora]|uniref:Meiotic recombination protein SPO11 n=1 Tax=Prunus yedoensis var. nudiflora TaxID=2094558 RepID=A0A314ZEB8_PRUYE|nr:meiotic recombination protein SPO11 [Prunus yedoensis var. nudiflora]